MNDRLMHHVHEGKNQLAKSFKSVADDAEALLRHGVKNAGVAYDEASERLQASLRQARAEAGDLQDALTDRASVAGRAAEKFVQRNPWQALAVVAAAGLLAGWVISRR